RCECFMLLLIHRLKVVNPCLERTNAEDPSRTWWQNINTCEQRAILEHTPTNDELSKSARIRAAQFRPNLQNGLCFRSKIERVLGLVIVQALQSVAIVEQRRRTSMAIRD